MLILQKLFVVSCIHMCFTFVVVLVHLQLFVFVLILYFFLLWFTVLFLHLLLKLLHEEKEKFTVSYVFISLHAKNFIEN